MFKKAMFYFLPAVVFFLSFSDLAFSKENIKDLSQIYGVLEELNSAYLRAFRGKNIYNWKSYFEAQRKLKALKNICSKKCKSWAKSSPELERSFRNLVKELEQLLKSKQSPELVRSLSFSLFEKIPYIPSDVLNSFIGTYRQTLESIRKKVEARSLVSPYEVNLFVLPKQTFYVWRGGEKTDEIKIPISPPKKPSFALGVFLRHVEGGSPLAGTDVSAEVLDKKGKQLSSSRLFLAWEGYPYYLGFIPLPKGRAEFILQITISPFPIDRIGRANNSLIEKREVRFKAKFTGGSIKFSPLGKKNLPLRALQSDGIPRELSSAFAAVGYKFKEIGPYRIGLSVLPSRSKQIWKWKNGSIIPSKERGRFLILSFLQSLESGFLIPNGRIHVFFYWKEGKDLYRKEVVLKPAYSGYYGYYGYVDLKPGAYQIRVRIDPPLMVTFVPSLPPTFARYFEAILY